MSLRVIENQNIWNSQAQTLVNAVNCDGVMGAGIALEFRLRYPQMYEDYINICDSGQLRPGLLWLYEKDPVKKILNFPTKDAWQLPTKEAYLIDGLQHFKINYQALGITSIAFPLLGAAQGGLSPERSLEIMLNHLQELPTPVQIYLYNPNAPDDIFPLMKSFLLHQGISAENLSTALGIRADIISALLEEIESNPLYCQMNQLLGLQFMNFEIMERLYAYFMHKDQEDLMAEVERLREH